MRTITLIFFFVLHASFAFSQQAKYATVDKKALKFYYEAVEYMRRAQFIEAIEPLNRAILRDDRFIEAWLALGNAHRRLGDTDTVIYFLKTALKLNLGYSRSKGANFTIGQIYYEKGKYTESQTYLTIYLDSTPKHPQNERKTKAMLSDCAFAIEALANPLDIDLENLGANANYFQLQYFPVLSVDQKQLFFTRREGSSIKQDEDIFYSLKNEAGEWSIPRSVSDNINTSFNEGACALSADGRTLVFTSCDGRRGYGSCDLFISYKKGEYWSVPKNLGRAINSEAWEAQPTLSADGRTIYFVSNRAGGRGGKDIWVARKDRKDKWQPAKNAGSQINSTKHEISPFIHPNEENIYFSSNGYSGMGGFDIFMCQKTDTLWSAPMNLGYPLNDHHDQISLYISSTGETGYYTIEKRDNAEISSQLYSFIVPDQLRVKRRSSYLTGTVVDAKSNLPLASEIQIYQFDNRKFYSKVNSDVVTGEYVLVLNDGTQYGIYATAPGYLFRDFSFSYQDIASFDSNLLRIALQPISVGAETVLGNIFFDFDDYSLKKESYSELRTVYRFLRKNQKVKVEISGHTDSKGSEAYNLDLSKKRAKTVYDFLVSKGISKSSLTYTGYGQSKPITSNDDLDSSVKNRRIEFKILEIIK